MRSACAVETQDLVVTYGVVTAVDQVTVRVAPGEIYGRVVPKERLVVNQASVEHFSSRRRPIWMIIARQELADSWGSSKNPQTPKTALEFG